MASSATAWSIVGGLMGNWLRQYLAVGVVWCVARRGKVTGGLSSAASGRIRATALSVDQPLDFLAARKRWFRVNNGTRLNLG
jgi:hypothetical protein